MTFRTRVRGWWGRRWVRYTVIGGLVVVLAGGTWTCATWPDVDALRTGWPTSTAFMDLDREARRAQHLDDHLDWRPVPYDSISSNLKRAVLVAEDIRFFSHHGFAFDEMWNAVKQAVREHRMPRGASTITQQLAKNLWLSPSRNPFRKLKEALLTLQLEHDLGKRRILELYLNVVELGPGIYGAEAASERYFGVPASELTEGQAAELAAALPGAPTWHPGSDNSTYRAHVLLVRAHMAIATFLWKLVGAEPPPGLSPVTDSAMRATIDSLGQAINVDTLVNTDSLVRFDTLPPLDSLAARQQRDSLLRDSVRKDSLRLDSLRRDSLRRDTVGH